MHPYHSFDLVLGHVAPAPASFLTLAFALALGQAPPAPGQAVSIVEQGHIRCGPEVVTDPTFLVSRQMEDYVTWVDTSRIKRTVMKYNDKLDDFDLL